LEFYQFEKQREYNDIEVGNDIKEKKRKTSEYYDLGKETEEEEKDTELVLFEKISALDIISLNSDKQFKNIVNLTIRESIKDKEKEKEKDKKKLKKQQSINMFDMVLDFSSVNDSKLFVNSFKAIISKFKAKQK
jgi:hypothetical protein